MLKRLTLLMLALAVIFANPACKKKGLQEDLLDPTLVVDSTSVAIDEAAVAAEAALVAEEALIAAAEEARMAEEVRLLAEETLRQKARQLALSSLTPVYFAFDKANLNEDARMGLANHVRVLEEYQDVIVRLAGHCDENGSVDYNLALGDRRALAVRDYFVHSGLDASRFTTLSFGKSRPVAPGHKEAAWKLNRRCEFKAVTR